MAANVELTAGRPVEVTVELATERRGGAVRIGHREPEPADLLDRAVAAAAGADVAVLDATYAASSELAVGDAIDVGGAQLEIVGVVASATSDAQLTGLPRAEARALRERLSGRARERMAGL